MKRFLYSLFAFLCMNLSLHAQDADAYNPENPPEPNPSPIQQLYTLALEDSPTGCCYYYYGNGRYAAGSTVWVYAYPYGDYEFKAWMEGDSVVSEEFYYLYTMPNRNVKLTAHFDYSPANPSEPSVIKPIHTLRLFSDVPNSGYFSNGGVTTLQEGNQTWVYAYSYSGFVFKGWYDGDSLLSNSYYLLYTMGQKSDTIIGRFEYVPSDPYDPQGNSNAKYNLSVLSKSANPGEIIPFPVYLMNENLGVHAAVFDILFPEGCAVQYADALLSSRKNGHVLNYDSIAPNTYRFTVSSSEMLPLYGTSGILLTIPIRLPLTWETSDSIHLVALSNAVLYSTLGDLYCPVKNGVLNIVSDTTTSYASFYPDIFLNRVKFSNLSSQSATSFYWEFGDGGSSVEKNPLHVYDAPGNYEVMLRINAGSKSDSIRMTVGINEESTWRMEGNFTLNTALSEVKNFTSLDELLLLMSRSNITQDVWIHVQPDWVFDLNLDVVHANYLDKIGKALLISGNRIHFESVGSALLNVMGFQNQLEFDVLKTWNKSLLWNRVGMTLFDVPVNFNPIQSDRSQVVCNEYRSNAVVLTGFSDSLATHARLIKAPKHIDGYVLGGVDTLPAMLLVNDSIDTDTLFYETYVHLNDTTFVLYQIGLTVLPSIHGEITDMIPATGTQLYGTTVQFAWKSIQNARYDLYLWEDSVPSSPILSGLTTNYTYFYDYLQYGKTYKWKVIAYGSCNQIESATDTFTVRTLPDLQVVEAIVPSAVHAGDWAEFSFRIKNLGGSLNGLYSNQHLGLATDSTLQKTLWLNSHYYYGNLEKDSSYWFTIGVVMPYDTITYTRFYLKVDEYNWLLESNEGNNTWLSSPIQLIQPTLDETDYQTLLAFYNSTSGPSWNRPWDVSSNRILSSNWTGVTFNRGRVTEVNLYNNGLKGELPACIFTLEHLRSLNLSYNQLTGQIHLLKDSLTLLASDSLISINLSNNELSGEVSAFASVFDRLNNLNLGGNRLSRVDQPLSDTITSLQLYNQRIEIPDFRLAVHPLVQVPSICWYDHEKKALDSAYQSFTLMRLGSYIGRVYYSNNQYRLHMYEGQWNYAPTDSFTMYQDYGWAYGSSDLIKIPYTMGDANIDEGVNVLDVQHSLNYIFMENPQPFNFYGANTYADDVLTVQDIVATVNLVLGSEDTLLMIPAAPRLRSAMVESSLEIVGNKLVLNASVAVSALDITLKNINGRQLRLLLNQSNFQWLTRNTADGVRFVIFSTTGEELTPGEHALADWQVSNVAVVSGALSDRQANPVALRISSDVTPSSPDKFTGMMVKAYQGVVTIDLDVKADNMTVSLYNAQGVLLDEKAWSDVSSGKHTIDYTSLVSSGLYILKLDIIHGDAHLSKNVKLIVSK